MPFSVLFGLLFRQLRAMTVVLHLRNTALVGSKRLTYARTFVTSHYRRAEVTPERSNNKIWKSADEAVADLQSGKTLFSGVSPTVPLSTERE